MNKYANDKNKYLVDPEISANRWVRNKNWLNIDTPLDTEEKCIILKAIFDSTQEWCALSAEGNYTVDWGDGNIENFASGITAEHTYNYADADLHDSSATLGYKQAIIQIYPQNGQQLTSLNLHLRHSVAGNAVYDSGFLDVAIAGANLADLLIGSSNTTTDTQLIRHQKLERTYLGINTITNFNYTLSKVVGLVKLARWECVTGTTHKGMLNSCRALQEYCHLDTVNSTDCSFFCYGNTAAKILPELNLQVAINIASLYDLCYKAVSIPDIFAPIATNTSSIYSSCRAATNTFTVYAPLSETSSSSFNIMTNVKNIGSLTFMSITNATLFFSNMQNITELPETDLFSVTTDITNLCNGVIMVKKLPIVWSFPAVTNASGAFSNMFLLEEFDKDLPSCQTFTNLFNANGALRKVHPINAANGTVFTNIVLNCGNLEEMILIGCRYTVSIANCKFPKENIEAFLAALGSAATGTQTITISGNPGTGTIYSKTATTTLGSKTVTITDTSNLVIGDRMTGTGSPLTTAIAVTFTDAGDTVNLLNHQLLDNDLVSFVSITTTTGIITRTPYYIVNATNDNFQLSLTVGGIPITLTNNGSGTMIYDSVIESIDPNVSITLSRPATSTNTTTKSFRSLNTAPAILKGFTISG